MSSEPSPNFVAPARYKEGDTVTIREWENMAAVYRVDEDNDIEVNDTYYTNDMKKYCGFSFLIAEVRLDWGNREYVYRVESNEMFDEMQEWTFSEVMFKKRVRRTSSSLTSLAKHYKRAYKEELL